MKNSKHACHVVSVFVVVDTAKLQVQESDTRWQERRIHYARAYMEAHELISISCFCIAWCLGLAQTEWPQNQASVLEPIAEAAAVTHLTEISYVANDQIVNADVSIKIILKKYLHF